MTLLLLAACGPTMPTTTIPTDDSSGGSYTSQQAHWTDDDGAAGNDSTDDSGESDTDTSDDEDDDQVPWYADCDLDGWGDADYFVFADEDSEPDTKPTSCTGTSWNWADQAGDCDDASPSEFPGASDVSVDGVDQDCNGTDGSTSSVDLETYYRDQDGDNYGDKDHTTASADGAPSGYVSNDDDCDDSSAAISPADSEGTTADGKDNDCDGTVDDGTTSSCTNHTYVLNFTGPSGASSLWIGGEIYDSTGDEVMPWETWTTGSPSGMTVSTSWTTITATYTACIESTDEWYVTAGYTSDGDSHWSCEGSSTLTGTFTVSRDGTSITTGACVSNGDGGSEFNW